MQKEYFTTSLEHILAELERIDLLIRLHAMQARQIHPFDDKSQEHFVPEQMVDELQPPSFGVHRRATASASLSQNEIRNALDQITGDIWLQKTESKRRGIRLRLDELEALFDLTSVERDIFLICLAPELDLLYERIYAYLQDDVTKNRPGVDLVSNLLGPSLSATLDARKYLAPEAPLCKYALLHFCDDPSHQKSPLPNWCLKADERVVNHLLDLDIIDPYLIPHVRRGGSNSGWEDFIIPAELKHHLALMIQNRKVYHQQGSVFYFQGPYGTAKKSTAEALCKELGLGLLIIDLQSMLGDDRLNFEKTLRLVLREALLQHSALYWQGFDLLLAEDKCAFFTSLLLEAKEQRGLTFLAGEKTWEPVDALKDFSSVHITFPLQNHAKQYITGVNTGLEAYESGFSFGKNRYASVAA